MAWALLMCWQAQAAQSVQAVRQQADACGGVVDPVAEQLGSRAGLQNQKEGRAVPALSLWHSMAIAQLYVARHRRAAANVCNRTEC